MQRAAPTAETVLLAALVRWGDDPLSIQTVLSAYTAAAVRVAQHAGKRQLDGAAECAAQQQQILSNSFAAAEQAVCALSSMQTDLLLLQTASGVLQPSASLLAAAAVIQQPFNPTSITQHRSAAATTAARDEREEHLAAQQSYWFDHNQGLRLVCTAEALWDAVRPGAGAGSNRRSELFVTAVASAVEKEAAAACNTEAAAAVPAAVVDWELPCTALELACALLVQPRWSDFCAVLTSTQQHTAQAASTSAERCTEHAGAGQLAGELARVINEHPMWLVQCSGNSSSRGAGSAAAALSGACWAHPAVCRACLEALASGKSVLAAQQRPSVAQHLRLLVGMLDYLGCLCRVDGYA